MRYESVICEIITDFVEANIVKTLNKKKLEHDYIGSNEDYTSEKL